MPISVNLQTVHPRRLAAVRLEVPPGAVGAAWGLALGKVWPVIRSQPSLWTNGHNIFLYHHPAQPGAPILCDFGVEVTRTFETAGEVYATETPGGEAAIAVHRGPYNRMNEAHDAIRKWMAANRSEPAGHSWEIYGDPAAGSGRHGGDGRVPPKVASVRFGGPIFSGGLAEEVRASARRVPTAALTAAAPHHAF
jgi:hypothetical protein